MSNLFESLERMFETNTNSLKDLAIAAGMDWRTLYRNQSLENCDLRGQDLRGMDLTGTNISIQNVDEFTQLDVQFDPRVWDYSASHRKFRIPIPLLHIVQQYAAEVDYAYIAWAYKSLFMRYCYYSFIVDSTILEVISKNEEFSDLVRNRPKRETAPVSFLVYGRQMRAVEQKAKEAEVILGFEPNAMALAIFHTLLQRKLLPFKDRDYSILTLGAIWPGVPRA